MGHHVDVHHLLDSLVGVFDPARCDEAGVGYEHVDRPWRGLDASTIATMADSSDTSRAKAVPPTSEATRSASASFRSATTTWRAPSGLGCPGQRLSDSRSSTSDDNDTIVELHVAAP